MDGRRTRIKDKTIGTEAQEGFRCVAEAIPEVSTFEKITVVLDYRGKVKGTPDEKATSKPAKKKR
jgi:hypothetical protein